jgi:iron complex transport system ATP-binding protein
MSDAADSAIVKSADARATEALVPQSSAGSWTLHCRDLCVKRGERQVLRDIGLTLKHGECVAVIGPNGAGKTTLILTLLGMLRPSAGSVELDGAAVRGIPSRRRGRWASYVPQGLDTIAGFSVFDVVAGGRYPHAGALAPLTQADLEAVWRAIARCGLTELAERPISAVSGGERQKALIAAAIAQDAQVMFLDEPTTALDPAYQIELVGLLRDWRASRRGVVMVTHDLQLAVALEGRVIAMREGRVVGDGPARELIQPERLERIYGAAFEEWRTADGRRTVAPSYPR